MTASQLNAVALFKLTANLSARGPFSEAGGDVQIYRVYKTVEIRSYIGVVPSLSNNPRSLFNMSYAWFLLVRCYVRGVHVANYR